MGGAEARAPVTAVEPMPRDGTRRKVGGAGKVHVVGAGLAGLACAVRLAGRGVPVVLYEAARRAGGRCRSFHDPTLGIEIDNGNHLVLSGNRAVTAFLDEVGAGDRLWRAPRAVFPFVDLAGGQRWSVRPGPGRLPGWIFSPRRRVPESRAIDYAAGLRLWRAGPGSTVAERLAADAALYRRFWEPLAVAVLNTPAEKGAARLLWPVLVETFGRGEAACRPCVAREGLSRTFVDPALDHLRRCGAAIRFGHRLREVRAAGDRAESLVFASGEVAVGPEDRVVLAVPAARAKALVPDIRTPGEGETIVNVHFRVRPAPQAPAEAPFLGLVGGVAQWLFVRGDIVSVTVSAAADLARASDTEVAARTWRDTADALGLARTPIPPNRVVKERRATFAQTPASLGRRHGTRTSLANLFLAGDWTDTGLPATLEGAARSGHAAAAAAGAPPGRAP